MKCLALANKSCQPGTNYKKNTNQKWKKKNGSSLVKVSSSTRRYNNNKVNNNNNDNNNSNNSNKHNNERGIIAKAFHMSSSFAFPLIPQLSACPKLLQFAAFDEAWHKNWKFIFDLFVYRSTENTIQNETMYSLPLLSTPMPMRKGIEAL